MAGAGLAECPIKGTFDYGVAQGIAPGGLVDQWVAGGVQRIVAVVARRIGRSIGCGHGRLGMVALQHHGGGLTMQNVTLVTGAVGPERVIEKQRVGAVESALPCVFLRFQPVLHRFGQGGKYLCAKHLMCVKIRHKKVPLFRAK